MCTLALALADIQTARADAICESGSARVASELGSPLCMTFTLAFYRGKLVGRIEKYEPSFRAERPDAGRRELYGSDGGLETLLLALLCYSDYREVPTIGHCLLFILIRRSPT